MSKKDKLEFINKNLEEAKESAIELIKEAQNNFILFADNTGSAYNPEESIYSVLNFLRYLVNEDLIQVEFIMDNILQDKLEDGKKIVKVEIGTMDDLNEDQKKKVEEFLEEHKED